MKEARSRRRKNSFMNPRHGYVRLLQIRDFGDKPFATYVPDSKRLKKATRDDLLLARYGGSSANDSLGRICTGLEGAYNVALAKLIFPGELVEKDYVRYLFLGPWFREKVSRNSRSCQTGFNREDVQDILFPIAPRNEQRRIAAKLDKLLGKVDTCQQRLAKVPVLLKRFRQSVLAAACSGRLTADWRQENRINEKDDDELPHGWSRSTVGNVLESLKYGTSMKCSYEKRGAPVLRIPNVVSGRVDHADLKFAELPEKELNQLRLVPGDLLLIRSNGSVSLVGRSAVVREAEKDFAYAGYLIRLRPNRKQVDPDFLNLALNSFDVRLQIELEARSTSGVNNINSEEVRALQFVLPPVHEQQEIVRRVEALFALADQIEARYAKAKAYIDNLTQSILAKAFRGELVPQDPNDEPASVLLERIQQTKTNEPKRKIRRKILGAA
jgi:type I restriction enzyme, S subunit